MEVILLGAMCMYSTVRYYQKHHCLFIVLSFSFNFMVLIVYRKFLDFYFQLIVSYFQPTIILCTARPWLRHIGFVLVYGPLALKTWRQELFCPEFLYTNEALPLSCKSISSGDF